MGTLTWQSQSDWDAAQSRYGVTSRSIGGFSGNTLRVGWDYEYGPLADAEHYWTLESESGATDHRGGYHLTDGDFHGPSTTPGVFGMPALQFDREDGDWIDLGRPPTFSHNGNLSVMAHIRVPEPYVQHKYIIGYARGKTDRVNGSWILYCRPVLDNRDYWEIGWLYRQDGAWHPGTFQRRELQPHTDHIVVASINVNSRLSSVTVDGHHESREVGTGHREDPTPNGVAAAIGDRRPGAERYWDGAISNVAYWDRALTNQERAQLSSFVLEDYPGIVDEEGTSDIDPSLAGGNLITAKKTDSLAAREITINAAVGSQRHIDISVYQDVTGDGTADNSATIQVDNGTNTYELNGFESVTGAHYWLEVEIWTDSISKTPELYSATVTTGEPQDILIPSDDQLVFSKQSHWDRAQDRARVVTREYGSRNPHRIELGFDPEYGPIDDAAFFAPLDVTTSRLQPTDVISGKAGTFGGSPVLSVNGGVGTSGMYSGGSADPGYATWTNMSGFQHTGSRTIAALIDADTLSNVNDKGVIIGAGSEEDGVSWSLEVREGQRLVFRYTTSVPWWKGGNRAKSKETVIRSFHSDFTEGYHAVIFVFDQDQEDVEVRGGKFWTVVRTSDISISISSSDIEIESSTTRFSRSRGKRGWHWARKDWDSRYNRYRNRKSHSFPGYKWWRGRRRKVRAIGLCWLGRKLDVKKLVLPLERPEFPPDVRIGRHPTQDGRDYYGVVDEVLYWPHALDETEVNEISRTYSDGYLVTEKRKSFGEAFKAVVDVDRPANTTIEMTIYQDTSGDGTANRSQTVTVPDGQTTISLSGFEAVDEAEYWVRLSLATRDKSQTPSINSVRIDLASSTGSVIDTDENGVITSDQFGSVDTS